MRTLATRLLRKSLPLSERNRPGSNKLTGTSSAVHGELKNRSDRYAGSSPAPATLLFRGDSTQQTRFLDSTDEVSSVSRPSCKPKLSAGSRNLRAEVHSAA